MTYEHIRSEQRDAVAVLTITRPEKRNSLALQTYSELASAIRAAVEDETVRAIVLTGEGTAFSSGADIDEVLAMEGTAEAAVARFRKSHGFIQLLATVTKPTIAAVNGDAAGAGCSVALACDIRLMSESGRIGLTFAKVGLGPDMGASYFLPRIVGLGKAYELAYTGDLLSAAEAERIGLVNRVLPADKVLDEAVSLASKIARGPRIALATAKRSLTDGLNLDLSAVLDREVTHQSLLFNSKDGQEGLRSFREKRRPVYE